MRRVAAPAGLIIGFCLLCFVTGSAYAADGAALYAENCAKCHGDDGKADTPVGKAMKAPALADPKWASEDSGDALVTAFRENAKHKSVSNKVSDDDLKAIAAHVRQLATAAE